MAKSATFVNPQKIIRDLELSEDTLHGLIEDDTLGRNKDLKTLINFLNSTEGGTFISLDGGWGSGKTVFVRQLDYLNNVKDLENISTVEDKDTCEQFQSEYITYYYNAWANDDQEPLQSLLFNLLKEASEGKDGNAGTNRFKKWASTGANIAKNLTEALGAAALNKIINTGTAMATAGIVTPSVDIQKLPSKIADTDSSEENKIKKLIENSTTISERKDAVSNIIGEILPERKKLLFIIDELDRCAPSFAVRLLEVIKHFYLSDNVVFLIVTNNSELSHTVKKFYGQEFDGMAYLDKFYDMKFRLPDPDAAAYIERQLQKFETYIERQLQKFETYIERQLQKFETHCCAITVVAKSIAQRFFMPSLREINRYCTMLAHLQKYVSSHSSRSMRIDDRSPYFELARYIFSPLALALAVKGTGEYDAFISGQGTDILKKFLEDSEETNWVGSKSRFTENFIRRSAEDVLYHHFENSLKEITNATEAIDFVVNSYEKLFSPEKRGPENEAYFKAAAEEFEKTTDLLQLTAQN